MSPSLRTLVRVATAGGCTKRLLLLPSLRTLVRIATPSWPNCGVALLPSLRTLVRVATAYMHKKFGACTDLTMCTLTLSSVKDAPVVQGLIPTISTLGREVAPYQMK